jgi:hypothetical protein
VLGQMASPRKIGPSVVRTYLYPRPRRKGWIYQARAVDMRAHVEAKSSSPDVAQALQDAWNLAARKSSRTP